MAAGAATGRPGAHGATPDEEPRMADLAYLLLTLVLFAALAGLVRGLGRL